jgi:hypothetical protein
MQLEITNLTSRNKLLESHFHQNNAVEKERNILKICSTSYEEAQREKSFFLKRVNI